MVVDSSAIIAILFDEPEAALFFSAIQQSSAKIISAPTLLEASIVAASRKGNAGLKLLDNLLSHLGVQTKEFSADHLSAARLAHKNFGKGQGHPAQLNFGDCISYAMSKTELMPLLFKGDDFRLTDVDCAI